MLTLGPAAAPAEALFTASPLAAVPLTAEPGAAPPASDALASAPVPATFRHPLEEAYRTSLLRPDVTAVLEARARTLGLPIVEVAWTHEDALRGDAPLRTALRALAAQDMPSMPLADFEAAARDADALPRDLQEALAKLVWRIVDAQQLQMRAFAPLSDAERAALAGSGDVDALILATRKVDVGAVLGAARAVDQAVKEAEPVLRKWSLLLGARTAVLGRPLTDAGLALGAPQLASASDATALGWALGLAARPQPAVPELPTIPLSHALAAFYRAWDVPATPEAVAALRLADTADPAVAVPLSRAVVATTLAAAYTADGLTSPTSVDAGRFLHLDREAARIAATPGLSAADLAILEEYAAAAEAIGGTPALTAAQLLLAAATELRAAGPRAAASSATGPSVRFAQTTTNYGPVYVHDNKNGTSVSLDLDGDGTMEWWSPSSQAFRVRPEADKCRVTVYEERHNDDEITPDEVRFTTSSLCDVGNNVTFQDPFGYFVVGNEGRTSYDRRLGAIFSAHQNQKTLVDQLETNWNGTIGPTGGDADGNFCVPFFGFFCLDDIFGDGDGFRFSAGLGSNDVFDAARRSNITVNSQHYQFLTWDLGGDDTYSNNAGGTYNWTEPHTMQRILLGDPAGVVALAVDLGGNDVYRTTRNYTIGSAQLGVGILVDDAGADTYAGPHDSVASSTGVRRMRVPGGDGFEFAGAVVCADTRRSCGGYLDGDPPDMRVGQHQIGRNEETQDPDAQRTYAGVYWHKSATAVGLLLDRAGDDRYKGGDRSLGFSNASYAYLLDLDGNDRYESRDHSQGVANNTGHLLFTGATFSYLLLPSVAALLDRNGTDTYVTPATRTNMTQGRGLGSDPPVSFAGAIAGPGIFVPTPVTVGLLLDLAGEDTGIRRNGNVTVGNFVEAGFRTRHVFRGFSSQADYPYSRPDHGVSLALDLDANAPDPTYLRPDGTVVAAPSGHVDMDEDPMFALDVYIDVPRLFVLGAETDTTYEHDAVVLVDLNGRDAYLTGVGAGTFDWNRTTSHDGRMRGQEFDRPQPEGIQVGDMRQFMPLPALPGESCRNNANPRAPPEPCTFATYEHGRVAPVALALDLEGSDLYKDVRPNSTHVRGFGYGLGGVGALYDLGQIASSDVYNVSTMGLGAAELFGAGILFDAAGRDSYRMVDGKRSGLGAASFGLGFARAGGVGVAIDASRHDDPGRDTYLVANHSLGAIVEDLAREYAVFVDENGADTYNNTARSTAHAQRIFPRPPTGEFDGFFALWLDDYIDATGIYGSDSRSGTRLSMHNAWCYYLRHSSGDAHAAFVDDGLAADVYAVARSPSGQIRGDNREWRQLTAAGQVAHESMPSNCRDPLRVTPPTRENTQPAEGDAAEPEGSPVAGPVVRGSSYVLGVDNLDAYYQRHAARAVRDPYGEAHATADARNQSAASAPAPGGANRVPLDEIMMARAVLLAPSVRLVDPTSGNTLTTFQGPLFGEAYPVDVTGFKGATSALWNALAFGDYLVRDTVPRTTCSFVPQPTEPVRRLGSSDNPDPADGGRPAVPGAKDVPAEAGAAGYTYRPYRRASNEMGYCEDARVESARADRYADDPCRVQSEPVRGVAPPGSNDANVCRDVADPNPILDTAGKGVDRLDLPLPFAAVMFPALAEALRLQADVVPNLAPHVAATDAALTAALVRVLDGDVDGAREALGLGFEAPIQASLAQPGNPCDPRRSEVAPTDDCQDVGRVEFFALRQGRLLPLGAWDNGRAEGDAVSVLRRTRAGGVDQVYYRHAWPTNVTTSTAAVWPDGPYDLLVRAYWRDNGAFGVPTSSAPGAYVKPEDQAAASAEIWRRLHDEYGYWPGETWYNLTIDNRPRVLEGLSRFGHFRPGDDEKRVSLVLTEPVKALLALERPGQAPIPLPERSSAAWGDKGNCAASGAALPPHQPVLHGTDVLEFDLPVAGLAAGVYSLVLVPQDCTHPERGRPARAFDGLTWSQWTLRLPIVADPDPPRAAVDFERDYLNPGDLVRCAPTDTFARCVELRFCDVESDELSADPCSRVAASPAARRQSPVESWKVRVVETAAGGATKVLLDTTQAGDTIRFQPRHGARYEVRVAAVDEAGNVQPEASVRTFDYDAVAPRVRAIELPATVRPDGEVVVEWETDAADPVFLDDVAGVIVEWATGAIPPQGTTPTRVWRTAPFGTVETGAGRATLNVSRVLGDWLTEDPDPRRASTDPDKLTAYARAVQNWTRLHDANLTDGAQFEVRLRAFDVHGNVEATDLLNGTITKGYDAARFDSILPNLTAAPSLKVLHNEATVTFELSEPGTATVRYGPVGGALEMELDTTPFGNGTGQRVTLPGLLQATDYAFTIEARDLVGNARAFPEEGTYLFSTDPVVRVEVPSPAADLVASGPVRVQWSAVDYRVDPYVTYQLLLSVDGGETFPYNLTPARAKPLYERTAPLRSFVFDTRSYPDTPTAVVRVLANNSLNPGAPLAFDSAVFRIDNAPPTTRAVLAGEGGVGGWYRGPVTVTFQPLDAANVSVVTRVDWSDDNVTFTTIEGPGAAGASIVVADEGAHEIFFRARDVLGNAEPVRVVRFSIDRTPPTATVVLEGGAGAAAASTVELEIAAADGESGVATVVLRAPGADGLVIPGERFRGGAFVQTLPLAGGDGDKTVEVTVSDRAGNRAVVRSAIRVDTTPPAFEELLLDRVAFESASGLVRLNEPGTLQVYVKRATDVGFQTRLDFGDPLAVHRVLVPGLRPSTTYAVRFVAYDTLGNAAEKTVNLTTLEDLSPPTQATTVAAADEGYGAVSLSWTPAQDNVGIDRYLVLRAPVEAETDANRDELQWAEVGVAFRPAYLDDDLEPGARYAYRVRAVDAAGNAGPDSGLAIGRATTRPVIEDGGVSPVSGSALETFTYAITYRDDDGDTPAFVRIYIDGEVYDMVKDRAGTADPRSGVRYVHHATLPPTRLSSGVHTFRFEASDGRSVVRFPTDGLDAAVGPAVFGDATSTLEAPGLTAALREAPAPAGWGALVAAAAAAALFARRRRGCA